VSPRHRPPQPDRRRAPRRAILAAGAMAVLLAALRFHGGAGGALAARRAVPGGPGGGSVAGGAGPHGTAGAPGAGGQPLDLLLITIDTLRADATGFGGHRPSPTPLLDRFAAAGLVFTQAHAHNVVTLPSHTNILTGLYPFQHGVRDNEGFHVPARVPTLATVLHGAGYVTGAFVGAYPLDSQFGLNRGFDVYDDHYPKGGNEDQYLFPERKGDKVVALALAWWQHQRGKRRFMWVHLFDPHAPYDPAEPFRSRFPGQPYYGEVAAADAYLTPLLAPFLAGAETPTRIIVTGDHGESLGEHGEETHGLFAYESTLHIPLVVWGPGAGPGREDRPVRHVDIFPTFLAAAGLTGARTPASPPGLERPGRSLLAGEGAVGAGAAGKAASAGGVAAPDTSYFEALSAAFNRGWAPLRGVLRQGHKVIALPLAELYDLPRDPGEKTNLIDADRLTARALLSRLPVESAWPPARQEPTGAAAAKLRSLGYAGGSAPIRKSYGPEDDPKRLIALDRQIHAIIDLYEHGRLVESAALARQLIAARPAMPLAHSLLAQALLQGGKKQEALAAMREAQRQGVAEESLLCQLGLTLSELGQPAEAIKVLRPLAARGAPQYFDALAQALSDAGRQQEAAATLQQALAIEPDDAAAYEEQSLIELRSEHWAAARDASQRALKLNGHMPRAWNNLGVALFQLREPAAALDAWQHAVDLDASLLDAFWNLGINAARLGRPQQARKALGRFLELAPESDYRSDREKARRLLQSLDDAAGGGHPGGSGGGGGGAGGR
jgi:arylsulfatase A-like enzyme/tetratricopeptide (TPR) repeat protein